MQTIEQTAPVAVNVTVSSQVEIVLDAIRSHTGQPLDGRVVNLVAAIPFLADCKRALRDSMHNTLIYAAALSGKIHILTDHGPGDDANVFDRIRPMLQYSGGDDDVLTHGSALLGLILVYGYHRDMAKDKAAGQYNPFNSGAWDFEEVVGDLEGLIEKHHSPAVERWMKKTEVTRLGWGA